MAGVVCLDGGVMVPSSCSLSVSTAEWLSGVVAPLSSGVGWLLMDSIRELRGVKTGQPDSYALGVGDTANITIRLIEMRNYLH